MARSSASMPPPDALAPGGLSHTLLEVALTGFALFRPVYEAGGEEIVDLAYEYLNPAAQRMLRLPECPTESLLTLFPAAQAAGIFAFYRNAFLSEQAERQQFNVRPDGLAGYSHLVAQRQGPRLVVSFTDANDQPRTAAADALGAGQAREQLRAQQSLLDHILRQVPAAVATVSGPEHRYTFFNDQYQALAAGRARLGLSVAEVFPEIVEQAFVDLLDRVYVTGEPFMGTETPARLYDPATGQAAEHYVDYAFQPLFDGQGKPQGILGFLVDVTERVLTRRQAETLQVAMLAAVRRQQQERENVYQLFEQSPAPICLLREPSHRVEYLNPAYQALFPGRALRGRTLAQLQPEAPNLQRRCDEVYQTGTA